MAEPTPFTEEQLRSDELGKKELIVYLQKHASKHVITKNNIFYTFHSSLLFHSVLPCNV